MSEYINRKTYPLALELLDLAEQKSLALLSAGDDGQIVELRLENVSAGNITLANGGNASQIELLFRKGVLEDVAQIELDGQAANSWSLTSDTSASRTDRISLTAQASQTLAPGAKTTLTLKNVKANKTQGAHNSGVEFRFQNMQVAGKPFQGIKRQVISLINQLPPEAKSAGLIAERIPLRVGFAESNTVLNDATDASVSTGTASELKIQITNAGDKT
ncbi:MAG: hypothetical protein R3264_03575, partial [Anaerolineae bacterium]|nr:hypothetical protein [Anaerolineae bacterium]